MATLECDCNILEQRDLCRACRVTEIGDCGQRFQPKEHRVLILG
jgi:hypothetical protein